MKVLVSTHLTQGTARGDYCWAVDGELVTPVGLVCSNPKCGCERGFSGLASSRATTTAMVVELEHIDEDDLERAVADSLQRGGWLEGLCVNHQDDLIDLHIDAIIDAGERYPVGTIVCRSRDLVYARESLAA